MFSFPAQNNSDGITNKDINNPDNVANNDHSALEDTCVDIQKAANTEKIIDNLYFKLPVFILKSKQTTKQTEKYHGKQETRQKLQQIDFYISRIHYQNLPQIRPYLLKNGILEPSLI